MGFVPWVPGKIEGRGFMGKDFVCSHALFTPDAAAQLRLAPIVHRVPKAGEEILLTAAVTDGQGHPILRDERPIAFRAEGSAEILATDNCNLMEWTPYSAHTLPAWHGKASVVILRTGKGSATIIAEAEGLQSAVWELPALKGKTHEI